MAYDTALAERIELLSLHWPGFSRKRMFGGLGYLLHDHMAFGIWHEQLVVRCGPEAYGECLERPGVDKFDITGRPMQGWLLVDPQGFPDDASLLAWLVTGRDFAATLPAK